MTTATAPPPMRAHPRVGGENLEHGYQDRPKLGSSPRGRGKHVPGRVAPEQQGLIPAWAGKTATRLAGTSTISAHPRVGGENRYSKVVEFVQAGLIPAWAGKTDHVGHSDA